MSGDTINKQTVNVDETELYNKYRSYYTSAFIDVSLHIFLFSSSVYFVWLFRNHILSCLAVPLMALMNIRTFLIFHDCGHNSYTPNKILNYIIGSICGVITFSPLFWKDRHNTHHITAGNINNSFDYYYYNETIYYTYREYKRLSRIKKICYKLFHHPVIFVCVLSVINFFILERISVYKVLTRKLQYKPNIIQVLLEQSINNIGIYFLLTYLYSINILHHFLLANVIFSFASLFMFHNQHTFNPSYVVTDKEWSQRNSGLFGSSFIQIADYLKYFTMGIEYHHVHHMNTKIPGYNLQKYHEDVVSKSNIFDNVIRLSIYDCCENLWLVIYDEDRKQYITFIQADEATTKES
jgi:omega-6 fatty acid desaturase (delta-12 desaturase)